MFIFLPKKKLHYIDIGKIKMFKVGDKIKHKSLNGIEAIVILEPDNNMWFSFRIIKSGEEGWTVGFEGRDPQHYWDLIESSKTKETELFCSRCTYSKVSNAGDFCNWCK